MKSYFKILISYTFLFTSCVSLKYTGLTKIAENNGEHYGPAEPSIAVSKIDPNIVVGGSIIDRVHYSGNAGVSFEHSKLTSDHGVVGDPVLWSDHKGNFYYVHLGNPDLSGRRSARWLESIVIHQSKDGGKTWDSGHAIGTNPPKHQDKPWISSHPTTGDLAVTWTEFDKYASKELYDKSRIRFSWSNDEGKTWSQAITISDHEGDCIDDDFTPEGAVPAFGTNNEIYVVWAFDQKIWFDKSVDNGKSWLPADKPITNQIGGWAQDVPGVGRANGMPVTEVDQSNNKYRGSIYVCWADYTTAKNNLDIWIMHSRDGGNNWSEKIKVNDDKEYRFQFFPWLTVDPVSGDIYLVYYSKINETSDKAIVTIAHSSNGAKSFKEMHLKKSEFTLPGSKIFFGDYNNISAVKGIVRPIWTSWDGQKLSVWTALLQNKK